MGGESGGVMLTRIGKLALLMVLLLAQALALRSFWRCAQAGPADDA